VTNLHARRHHTEGTGSGDEPSRVADGAAREAGGGNDDEHARQDQEALRGFFVAVQGAARHYSLDAVLL
jgi:hypothetical protein